MMADHILAALIFLVAVVLPAADAPRTRRILAELSRQAGEGLKLGLYWEMIAWLWVIAVLVIGVWLLEGHALAELGLRGEGGRFWLGMAAALAGGLCYLGYYRHLQRSPRARANILRDLQRSSLDRLVPETRRELRRWRLLSVSAASEELVYRGFLLWYLNQYLPLAAAGLLCTLSFAAAHAYQGWRGVLQTGAAGAVLLLLTLASASLWPAMILHVMQDLFGGYAGYLCNRDRPTQERAARLRAEN